MLIRVVYPSGKYDMVKESALDRLIDEKAIHSFKRSNGWVLLGVDPLRNPRAKIEYSGQKRRAVDFPHTDIENSAPPANVSYLSSY